MKQFTKSTILFTLVLLACGIPAFGGTVFSDDFQAQTPAYNATLTNWTVSPGTVDLLGPGFANDLCGGGTTRCVDLVGSNPPPTGGYLLSQQITFTGGVQYTLSFLLAGSQRQAPVISGPDADTNTVDYGIQGTAFTGQAIKLWDDPFATTTLIFTFATTTTGRIFFDNTSNIGTPLPADSTNPGFNGALLDNVSVTFADAPNGVPEPATAGLLLLGLAIGATALRRRRA